MQRYRSFGAYVKKNFGTTVYKVNVDAGFTCPNRDGVLGVTGCIYCNNNSFRPGSCKPALTVSEQVRNGIVHVSRRYKARKFIVYFQPFTNTYAPVEKLEALYREALDAAPSVAGLAIGTRPDAIDDDKLSLLSDLARNHFILIEYGLQSIYDRSLAFIHRGHNYETFLKAIELTQGRGINIGCHIIAGLPTETREETLAMADEISSLQIGFLKVHQLQVVRDTLLKRMYRDHPFSTFAYDDYVNFIVDFLERLSPEIVIQRLFATAPDNILIAPQWGRNRHQILRDIEKALESRDTWQGKKYKAHALRV
jgi:radical SAM protein (TIGR01212 family)